MGAPPSSTGAVQLRATDELLASPVGAAGAAGVVRGVPGTTSDGSLNPLLVTIRILTRYVVPFASPVTTSGLIDEAGERVVQVDPPSSE